MLNYKNYNRTTAVEYAKRWALSRNPRYFDFSDYGGDCTNFISQCLYAGSNIMNYTPTFGWYYITSYDRTPSWTGVNFLYDFLVNNTGPSVYASIASLSHVEPGDVIQLGDATDRFYHSLLICGFTHSDILICTHTNDSYMRPLSSYHYATIRYLHVEGVRY
jgi:hypothetical protein